MKLAFDDIPWQQWDKPSKLLGTYEQETHGFFRAQSGPDCDCVIDIGCSEGYLAVGLALLNPNAKVFAYDTNEVARRICAVNAELNDVRDRVSFGHFCDPAELLRKVGDHKKCLVVVDCEGYEKQLFESIETCWALSRANILIECHDMLVPGVSVELSCRLAITHRVTTATGGSRDPNRMPFMRNVSDLDRWRAVCEFRSHAMTWLLCEAKS